jgi:hypothetical protein
MRASARVLVDYASLIHPTGLIHRKHNQAQGRVDEARRTGYGLRGLGSSRRNPPDVGWIAPVVDYASLIHPTGTAVVGVVDYASLIHPTRGGVARGPKRSAADPVAEACRWVAHPQVR